MHADERVQWAEHAAGRPLTPGEALAVQVVCDALGTGPWNVLKAKCSNLTEHGYGGKIVISDGIATVDNDHLTRLVFAAHDRCARVAIDQSTPHKIGICVWQRQREGGLSKRHPTLEQAVADWRRNHEVRDAG